MSEEACGSPAEVSFNVIFYLHFSSKSLQMKPISFSLAKIEIPLRITQGSN